MGLIVLCRDFGFYVMNVKEPIKSFEQAGSIQICELELLGSCGDGRNMVSVLCSGNVSHFPCL